MLIRWVIIESAIFPGKPFTTTGKGTIISVNATYNQSYGVIYQYGYLPPEEVGLYYNFTDPLGNNYTDQLGYHRKFIDTNPGSYLSTELMTCN